MIEHRPDMRSIVNILVGQVGGDNLARVGIDADVKFAPGAPLCRSMLFSNSHSPAAAQFQACAVDDQMERVRGGAKAFCSATFNPPAPAAERCVIGNGQVNPQQLHDRTDQALPSDAEPGRIQRVRSAPSRSPEIRIGDALSAWRRTRQLSTPICYGFRGEPDRQASAAS